MYNIKKKLIYIPPTLNFHGFIFFSSSPSLDPLKIAPWCVWLDVRLNVSQLWKRHRDEKREEEMLPLPAVLLKSSLVP